MFGVVYTLQSIVGVVDVFVDHWSSFNEMGAGEFLGTFYSRPVRGYAEFYENFSSLPSYQVVVWMDFHGWEMETHRMKGPRGTTLCLSCAALPYVARPAPFR